MTILRIAAALLALASTAAQAQQQGFLENPYGDIPVSGIVAISGWHCTAQRVEIQMFPDAGELLGVPAAPATTIAPTPPPTTAPPPTMTAPPPATTAAPEPPSSAPPPATAAPAPKGP